MSNNDQLVVAGSSDGITRVLNIEENSVTQLIGNNSMIKSVAIKNNQLVVAGSSDGKIYVWDIDSPNNSLITLCGITLCSHTSSVNSVTFSDDEQYLLSGSSDGTICKWDYNTEIKQTKESRRLLFI